MEFMPFVAGGWIIFVCGRIVLKRTEHKRFRYRNLSKYVIKYKKINSALSEQSKGMFNK